MATTPIGNGAPIHGYTSSSRELEERAFLIQSLHKALTSTGGTLSSDVNLQPLKANAWLAVRTNQKVRVIRVWEHTLLTWTVGESEPREVNKALFETDISEGLLVPWQ